MRIDTHVNLKPYHTFGIDTHASQFTRIQHRAELNLVLQFYTQYQPLLILGGGSNVLFTKPFEGLIIKNELKGIRIKKRLKNETLVEAASGESWHAFVCWALKH
ncbi:MAG: FAD-binding protein, partial [Bacteroidia bacterium]